MISFIRSWAEGIIVTVVIATILEMILPEGNNKKYIKMVIGIYVLFVMISPIINKITKGEISFEKSYEDYFNNSEYQLTSSTVEQSSNSSIQKIYLENLKKDIGKRLEEKGYEAINLEIEAEFEKEETYGSLKKVRLSVKKKEKTEEVKTVNEVKIQIGEKEEKAEKLKAEEEKEIKKILIENYGMQEENIFLVNG